MQIPVFARPVIHELGDGRAHAIVDDIAPYLQHDDRVLEIGAGSCQVSTVLMAKSFDVTMVDVVDKSLIDGVSPIVYDGKHLPFRDREFDVALFLNVLHHIADPDAALREAKRVARRIVIHEDIYNSIWQKYLTFGMDSVTNLEFIGHPHTNRDDAGWKQTFAAHDLTLVDAKYKHFWKCFANATYCVEAS
ncbi:MAG: class I SAM-dependent methyltransferase [Candidatus Uhrbacteria bacterium]|nr:class I SAM-dependent methyltransferase [Candidatus Uhrbacteria bacterium]